MSAKILDGTAAARTIREELKATVAREGLHPTLAVILVGDDEASALYVSLKEKVAQEIGITVTRFNYPTATDEREVIHQIRELNKDTNVNGILVQLPLPPELNPNAVTNEIDPEKDVDGFNPHDRTDWLPPVVAGAVILLNKTGDIAGKHAVVIGNSAVFTQTFCDALRERDVRAEPTFPDNVELIRTADIIVTAVGRPYYLTAEMVKPGATVIDIGTSKYDGKTVGDVAPDVVEVAAFLSPVPGGVGPMTVAMVSRNVVELCRRQSSPHPASPR
jgi:methylenetetrahydrofolate dehydrogenase (NADP+)/methenyltetrahydrofolate cyclohydrolase